MRLARYVGQVFLVATMSLGAGWVSGQAYPQKPIRIITTAAGGGSDGVTRVIAQGISGPLGQPVIVENRVNFVGIEIVQRAQPDGYTLLLGGAPFWLGPLLQTAAFDPVKDFSPITLALTQPNMVVVPTSLPVKSVKDLIALAKSKPGQLNYASGQIGNSNQLAAELFKAMAGVDIVRIGYQSGAAAATALMTGEAHVLFIASGTGAAFVKSGKMRAIAVTSLKPTPLAPGIPTVAESGLPGFESTAMSGVFTTAKTPTVVITRLNQEIVRFLTRAEVKEKLFNIGQEVVASTPAQLDATMKSEMTRLGKVIKDVGIRAE